MKTKMFAVALLALGAAFVAGCTTSQPVATTKTKPGVDLSQPGRRTYTAEELQKRGRPTIGEALAAEDPSIQTTGH